MQRLHVWDLPTRLFHWLLVIAITTAFVTGYIGGNLIDWHGRAGLFVLGLVSFRVVWGVIGSPTARFANFVRGPAAIRAYLRGQWQGVGHNPLGALSVLALLALVAAQAGTGLFVNDDIAFEGPLAGLVSKDTSDRLLGIHVLLQNVLIGLVAIHLAAIVFYARFKRENLVGPMVTGWKAVETDRSAAEPPLAPAPRRRLAAFALSIALASATVYAAAGGLLPAPDPTAAPAGSAAPAW